MAAVVVHSLIEVALKPSQRSWATSENRRRSQLLLIQLISRPSLVTKTGRQPEPDDGPPGTVTIISRSSIDLDQRNREPRLDTDVAVTVTWT